MTLDYLVYGLRIRSNMEIRGPRPVPTLNAIDLHIEMRAPLSRIIERSIPLYDGRGRTFKGQGLRLHLLKSTAGRLLYHWAYMDGTEFLIDEFGLHLWVNWTDGETVENASSYLLGPILAFVLRLRGIMTLHASAVAVDGRAIALAGPPGAGKSTTVTTFAMMGYPVVTDDVVSLTLDEGRFLVYPGYPRLRLWPESAELLFGSREALPPILSRTKSWLDWNKCYVDLKEEGYPFQARPLHLGAVYLLSGVDTHPAAPFIESMPAQSALVSLAANAYAGYFSNHLMDRDARKKEFDCLSQVVAAVPLRRISVPEDRIPPKRFCKMILDDLGQSLDSPTLFQDS